MEPAAIVMMILFLAVIWGGLVLSIFNFVKNPDAPDEDED